MMSNHQLPQHTGKCSPVMNGQRQRVKNHQQEHILKSTDKCTRPHTFTLMCRLFEVCVCAFHACLCAFHACLCANACMRAHCACLRACVECVCAFSPDSRWHSRHSNTGTDAQLPIPPVTSTLLQNLSLFRHVCSHSQAVVVRYHCHQGL